MYDVIVIGAGVVGPAIATALARQGRKVCIIERNWEKPDRIVGELMQPGGVKALQELGMVHAINNIQAWDVTGYYIKYYKDIIEIDYPLKSETGKTNPMKPVPDCVFDDNDKIMPDLTVNSTTWNESKSVRGIAFHHGDFIGNMRKIVKSESNIDWIEGTVTKILRSSTNENQIIGVVVKLDNDIITINAKLTISCDGIYSKFRKEVSPKNVPTINSYFVGLHLKNVKIPAKYRGHVILGDHAPILVYQISPEDTRILCAYSSPTPPSSKNDELYTYMKKQVLKVLPSGIKLPFYLALKERKFRIMPNQYLPALPQNDDHNQGLILLGDSLNMRHPLTGGGMTVGLNDAVVLSKLLHPDQIEDLSDYKQVRIQMIKFHKMRNNLDSVINTLSVALYALFAADKNALKILQKGCFKYFQLGGTCVSGPIGLLSGMLPFPLLLFNHFFSVAFYAIYCNFIERGILGFPIAILESIDTIFTAVLVFAPYLWKELVL
jgi:squalene monooxygenase